MRPSLPLLLVVLLVLVASMSCRFISGSSPETSPEPPFNNYDAESLIFVPDSLPDATLGKSYEVKLIIENVETFVAFISISKAKLPTCLVLERVKTENAANIIGIPQETGTFTFALEVQCMGTNDPGQVGEKEYTIIVKPAP